MPVLNGSIAGSARTEWEAETEARKFGVEMIRGSMEDPIRRNHEAV